jgi:hypothetical protein
MRGEHYHVIPVHEALEHSSDVAAVTLALKVGPDKFYDYMRSFGFGSRSGVELPGETRGLLRPVKGTAKVKGWSGVVDWLSGNWAGSWCDATADGVDGFDDCEWRCVLAAACADGRTV